MPSHPCPPHHPLSTPRRRPQDFQSFLQSILGGNWRQYVPQAWTSPSFDWARLGTFEYSSNVGEFFSARPANITDAAALLAEVQEMESLFCKHEK